MMPDFFEIFRSCTLADNGLSIWTTKMHPVVVKSCGHRMWSLVVSICDVTRGILAINASIGNSKLQWINGGMED